MPLHSSPHPSLSSAGGTLRRQPFASKTNTSSRLGSPSPAGAAPPSTDRSSADLKPKAKDYAAAPKASSAPTSARSHPPTARKAVRGRASSSQASSVRTVEASRPRRTRRDGSRRDDPSPALSSARLAADRGDGGLDDQQTPEITPIKLENDLFGFGASLALTQQSHTSLQRATPPLSFSQQASVGLSDPLSDLPSTPSTHRAPSEPGEAEDRIDEILGRKRRASTPKANGEGARGSKRAKKVKSQAAREGKGARRSMRTRAHDAEPESEDDQGKDVMVDVPSPSPSPPPRLVAERSDPFSAGEGDEHDPDATIRSRTPTAESVVHTASGNVPADTRDKSRSPSLASDDFYS